MSHVKKDKITKGKILAHSGTWTHYLSLTILALKPTALLGLSDCWQLKVNYIHINIDIRRCTTWQSNQRDSWIMHCNVKQEYNIYFCYRPLWIHLSSLTQCNTRKHTFCTVMNFIYIFIVGKRLKDTVFELLWIHSRVYVYHLPINVYSENEMIAQSVRVPI